MKSGSAVVHCGRSPRDRVSRTRTGSVRAGRHALSGLHWKESGSHHCPRCQAGCGRQDPHSALSAWSELVHRPGGSPWRWRFPAGKHRPERAVRAPVEPLARPGKNVVKETGGPPPLLHTRCATGSSRHFPQIAGHFTAVRRCYLEPLRADPRHTQDTERFLPYSER